MLRTSWVLIVMAVLLLVVGCSNEPNPIDSQNLTTGEQMLASKIIVPAGATLESATFYIYVNQFNNQTIDVHRVTADWEETVVTWNNFGGSFDANIEGSFIADGTGWRMVDVTSLVQGWMSGDVANYGILIDQVERNYPRARYNSREAFADQPYLEICFTTDNGVVCETTVPIGDTYIWEREPDWNFGTKDILYTGWLDENDYEKQSLLKFELEVEPPHEDGCTRTIGYWKTHAGFGPQADMVTALLPVWLGDSDGSKSMHVINAGMAVDILSQNVYGKANNGITKLYAQLLGAKLNIASGASDDEVADVINDADAFLADHDWTEWSSLSKTDQKMVLGWQSTLDMYNNGYIGPDHCDDEYFELGLDDK